MTKDPDLLIQGYEMAIKEGLVDSDEYETEAILALMERDAIEEIWVDLTEAQKRKVQDLDDLLIHKHNLVADVLPNAAVKDRRRWWWFLHEGPQVREQAQNAA